jgi:hypothetical protein
MKKKILFICKKRNSSYDVTGKSYGLLNSCRLVGEALHCLYDDIDFKVVVVNDNNDIDREVYNYKPTHVIIEALWVVPSKFEQLLPKYKGIKWTVRLHSKAPFIANEGVAFEWMNEYTRLKNVYENFSVSVNDKDFAKDLTDLFDSTVDWLPNIYTQEHECGLQEEARDPEVINIGCFGAIRPLKNHLEQAIAAIIFADNMDKKLRFHINAERVEQRGENVLKNLRALFEKTKHELVEHPWYEHQDFIHVVRKMDIGMQISFSETFNIVAADFVTNNVPVIVSDEIAWASRFYKVSTTNTTKIVRALRFAWVMKCVGLQGLNLRGLRKHNNKAIVAWMRYIFSR